MTHFTRQQLSLLMAPRRGPCVTLTMPTHRRRPEADQNAVRHANLLKVAAEALDARGGRRDPENAALLEQLETLGGAEQHQGGISTFWHHQKDGLAIFAAPGFFALHRVPVALREITVVADSFHVKPLLPLLFDDQRYHLLALTVKDVRLFEGSQSDLQELRLADVPGSLEDALGSEQEKSRVHVAAHGGSGAGQSFISYGKGSDDEKEHLRRYFRAVDRAVDERLSRPTGLPLILAAVDYYHPLYREVAHDRHLVAGGITSDPKSMSNDQLRQAAWDVFEPLRQERVRAAVEAFGTARSHGTGSNELAEVAQAAAQGRIRSLLLEEKRRTWGRIDRTTGEIHLAEAPGRQGDVDILDELAELTILSGGDVHLLPKEKMPAASPVAAMYRY